MSDSFLKLVNPSFKLEWNNEVVEVKKATLEMVAKYQQRASEYAKDNKGGNDQRLGAYALYLILETVKPEITEGEVLANTPGDIDLIELFTSLGFMNPARFQAALKMAFPATSTSENSGVPSATEQDGLPEKSES